MRSSVKEASSMRSLPERIASTAAQIAPGIQPEPYPETKLEARNVACV